jgi:hypothetical protein
MVKDRALYRLSPIYHFWHFLCDFAISVCIFCIFGICAVHFFAFFMCFKMKNFCVHFYFCVHFLKFLLLPIVEVDISDIAIISGITNMVKTIKLVINNTPQKTHRIAQYTVAWYRLHALTQIGVGRLG